MIIPNDICAILFKKLYHLINKLLVDDIKKKSFRGLPVHNYFSRSYKTKIRRNSKITRDSWQPLFSCKSAYRKVFIFYITSRFSINVWYTLKHRNRQHPALRNNRRPERARKVAISPTPEIARSNINCNGGIPKYFCASGRFPREAWPVLEGTGSELHRALRPNDFPKTRYIIHAGRLRDTFHFREIDPPLFFTFHLLWRRLLERRVKQSFLDIVDIYLARSTLA